MPRFTFSQTIKFNDKEYFVSGSGDATVTVNGHYEYDRGDYWTPPSSDIEIYSVDVEDIDDIEIDDIEEVESDEEFDALCNDESFIDSIIEQLDIGQDDFDEEDLEDILIERANDHDYYDDYDD